MKYLEGKKQYLAAERQFTRLFVFASEKKWDLKNEKENYQSAVTSILNRQKLIYEDFLVYIGNNQTHPWWLLRIHSNQAKLHLTWRLGIYYKQAKTYLWMSQTVVVRKMKSVRTNNCFTIPHLHKTQQSFYFAISD